MKRNEEKRSSKVSSQFSVWLALVCAGLVALAGCGGSSSSVSRKTPTTQTRTRIAQLQSQSFRAIAQSGVQPASFASARNGAYAGGTGALPTYSSVALSSGAGIAAGIAPSANTNGSNIAVIPAMPLVGAFINNVAAKPRAGRAAHISRMLAKYSSHSVRSRDSSGTIVVDPTVPPSSPPTVYFDDYLGLWVQIVDTATQSTYNLFQDQALTQPAGSIVTIIPTGTTYPQVYSSTYSFTAGLQAGSHGAYQTTQNADGSGSSTYNDTYVDGWSDSGTSNWSGQGDYSWTDRTDGPNGVYTASSGDFLANGSGGTQWQTSDGYKANFVYNADGSGHGTISGNQPGLPAVITWDIYGNTTIQYADGSIDYTPGWGYGGGDVITPIAVSNSGTATGTGSGSSSGTTTTVSAPAKK